MKTVARKVDDVLNVILKNYKMKTRENGETYYVVEVEPENPVYEFLVRNNGEVCEGIGQLDDWYECLGDWAEQLASTEFADESEAHELVADQEPDVYTSDLTEWLNRSNYNVYYLTEVLEELDIKDGFQALAAAQQRQREEWAHNFVDGLFAYAGEEK